MTGGFCAPAPVDCEGRWEKRGQPEWRGQCKDGETQEHVFVVSRESRWGGKGCPAHNGQVRFSRTSTKCETCEDTPWGCSTKAEHRKSVDCNNNDNYCQSNAFCKNPGFPGKPGYCAVKVPSSHGEPKEKRFLGWGGNHNYDSWGQHHRKQFTLTKNDYMTCDGGHGPFSFDGKKGSCEGKNTTVTCKEGTLSIWNAQYAGFQCT